MKEASFLEREAIKMISSSPGKRDVFLAASSCTKPCDPQEHEKHHTGRSPLLKVRKVRQNSGSGDSEGGNERNVVCCGGLPLNELSLVCIGLLYGRSLLVMMLV